MNKIKAWPHLTVVALAFALVGGAAGALWVRHERKAEAMALPSAARVERVEGEVGLNQSLNNKGEAEQWTAVTPNMPLSAGDRIYARDNSQASIAFTGRNFARLDPDSALDVIDLTDRRTQLALRDGSAIFNVGELGAGDMFEVATPLGAVDLQQPGLYEIGLNDDGSAWVSVLSGLAQVVGLAGSGQVSKGEMLTLLGQAAADIALSRISPDYAGGLLDDYYGYQYPDTYDGRYSDYNAYLNDPDYYDPAQRYQSYQYVADSIPGVWELDRYGEWQNLSGYGNVWRPRVEEGWAPYRQGSWTMDNPYGMTWVSDEPWGYAPYHYGRWVNAGDQWYWAPDGVNTQPVYSPALVSFIPLPQTNEVGWAPLAPGDPYSVPYYDANWQPQYATGAPEVVERSVNFDVPGAVTVIPVNDFGNIINAKSLRKFERQAHKDARPVNDPMSVAILRQQALQATNRRRRVDIPPGIAKRLDGTQVYTSAQSFAPPFKEGRRQLSRVEAVPEQQKKQKLQYRDERQAAQVAAPSNAPGRSAERKQRIERLQAEASRGNVEARRESQQLRQQERRQERVERVERRQAAAPRPQRNEQAQAASERAMRMAEQRAQGERVAQDQRAQRDAARRQAQAAPEQQRAIMRPQAEGRRQAERQAAQQRAPQQQQQRRQSREMRAPSGQNHQPQAQPQPRPERGHGGPKAAQPRPQGEKHNGGGGKGKGRP